MSVLIPTETLVYGSQQRVLGVRVTCDVSETEGNVSKTFTEKENSAGVILDISLLHSGSRAVSLLHGHRRDLQSLRLSFELSMSQVMAGNRRRVWTRGHWHLVEDVTAMLK